MIDEAVLEDLLARAADEIPVPAAGPEQVLRALPVASNQRRRTRPHLATPLLAAAVVIVLALVAVPVLQSGSSSSKSRVVTAGGPAAPPAANANARARQQLHGAAGLPPGANSSRSTSSGAPSSGPVDAAKIVKTGTLDLQVPHGTLRVAVNRVTSATVGLGGYVANSRTSYGGADPTAQITVRVPAGEFEAAITRLDALPGVKVLGESENGTDVTAQYADLQAQLSAATSARDALLGVLSNAQTVGDILAVQDRVTAAQTQVEQLQQRINVLGDQAAFSSLGVTLSEKPTHAKSVALHRTPDRGLAKAWADARHGFSNSIEWIIARSGGALIVLLAALAILFGIRYLYPIVRRGLL
jgi:hypothetical protein